METSDKVVVPMNPWIPPFPARIAAYNAYERVLTNVREESIVLGRES
jgi:hypothetical protein